MKTKTIYFVIAAIVLAAVIFYSSYEGYGQDASIRVSAGGVAGSGMYGYDPITEFAEQIDRVREQVLSKHKEGFCPYAESGMCPFAQSGMCPFAAAHIRSHRENFCPFVESGGICPFSDVTRMCPFMKPAYPSYPNWDKSNKYIYTGQPMSSPNVSGPCGCC